MRNLTLFKEYNIIPDNNHGTRVFIIDWSITIIDSGIIRGFFLVKIRPFFLNFYNLLLGQCAM